jgi:hypothetical protein
MSLSSRHALRSETEAEEATRVGPMLVSVDSAPESSVSWRLGSEGPGWALINSKLLEESVLFVRDEQIQLPPQSIDVVTYTVKELGVIGGMSKKALCEIHGAKRVLRDWRLVSRGERLKVSTHSSATENQCGRCLEWRLSKQIWLTPVQRIYLCEECRKPAPRAPQLPRVAERPRAPSASRAISLPLLQGIDRMSSNSTQMGDHREGRPSSQRVCSSRRLA